MNASARCTVQAHRLMTDPGFMETTGAPQEAWARFLKMVDELAAARLKDCKVLRPSGVYASKKSGHSNPLRSRCSC